MWLSGKHVPLTGTCVASGHMRCPCRLIGRSVCARLGSAGRQYGKAQDAGQRRARGRRPDRLGWTRPSSRNGSVIIVQQSSETLTSLHLSDLTYEFWIRENELVVESLMVAFVVVQL